MCLDTLHLMKLMYSKFVSLPRFNVITVILAALIIYNIFLGINYINYVFNDEDAMRNYLISHHIVKYAESPNLGPSSSVVREFTSTLPFYLFSSVLIIHDSVYTLQWLQIILKVITLISLYLIAKDLFSRSTGLITVILFTFSHQILQLQTYEFWEPGIMTSFLYFSVFLLVRSLISRNYLLLVAGCFFYIASFAIHLSALGVLPFIAILSFFSIKKMKLTPKYVIFLVEFVFVITLVFYFTTIIHFLQNQMNLLTPFTSKGNTSISLIKYHFNGSLISLSQALGFTSNKTFYPLANLALIIIVIGSIGYFLYSWISKDKKIYLSLILGIIASYLLFSSFISTGHGFWYLAPVFGLCLIYLAEIINTITSKKVLGPFLGIPIVLIFVIILSQDMNNFSFGQRIFEKHNILSLAALAIEGELHHIQKKDNIENLNFFQIKSLNEYNDDGSKFHDTNAGLWNILEKDLDTKFTTIYDSRGYQDHDTKRGAGFISINKLTYIFLVCDRQWLKDTSFEGCKEKFNKYYPGYVFANLVYSRDSYRVYSMKKV